MLSLLKNQDLKAELPAKPGGEINKVRAI